MAFYGKKEKQTNFLSSFLFYWITRHHSCCIICALPLLGLHRYFFPVPWKLPALLQEFVELFLGVISHRPTAGAGAPINSRLDASANLTSRTRQSFET